MTHLHTHVRDLSLNRILNQAQHNIAMHLPLPSLRWLLKWDGRVWSLLVLFQACHGAGHVRRSRMSYSYWTFYSGEIDGVSGPSVCKLKFRSSAQPRGVSC